MADYQLRVMKVSEIRPADYNPRAELQRGQKEYEKLKASIDDLGIVDPLVWNETTGRLVGGHQRLRVLMDSGVEEVPCFVVHLSEQKERQANLALNKISGRFDAEKLEAVLHEIDPAVARLAGFDDKDLKELDYVGVSFAAREFGEEEFGDDRFEYECPNCGFRFNP